MPTTEQQGSMPILVFFLTCVAILVLSLILPREPYREITETPPVYSFAILLVAFVIIFLLGRLSKREEDSPGGLVPSVH